VIQDYPASKSPPWKVIGSEVLASVAAVLLFPLGLRRTKRRMPRKEKQRTIVLVHGYLANRSALFVLHAYLRARGIREILTFSYDSSLGVEAGARSLKVFLAKHVRGGRIDLVCHSMGGLVARLYLQELGGARRVDRCITLGTPHHGTYNAYWVATRVGRELRPDSELLSRLAGSKDKAACVRFTSIVAGSDNVVIPRIFAANETTIHIPDLGHMGLLFSLSSFRSIATHLAV